MKRFALIGAAGYIAPRHMKAIKETGNILVAALDKHDSVGTLDSYFPDTHFFTEFERFDRHLDKLRRKGQGVDYVSICSPNYLHDSHIRFALKQDANAICEKPLVLNPWNLDALAEMEQETNHRIYTILQLRLHPAILALRDRILSGSPKKIHDVELNYITSRGRWYHTSWKGEISKSGGIATNIGIHFFDALLWIFGEVVDSIVLRHDHKTAQGELRLERATVRWLLSIDEEQLPTAARQGNHRTFRSIKVGTTEVEFSSGFTDLHTESYKHILSGKGFGLADVRQAIQLVYNIRNSSAGSANRRQELRLRT